MDKVVKFVVPRIHPVPDLKNIIISKFYLTQTLIVTLTARRKTKKIYAQKIKSVTRELIPFTMHTTQVGHMAGTTSVFNRLQAVCIIPACYTGLAVSSPAKAHPTAGTHRTKGWPG